MFKRSRSIAVHIALVAMLLRALLPAGWMPTTGGTTLEICSGIGLTQIHLDSHGDRLKGAPAHKSQDICPFAAVAHLAAPAPAVALAAPFARIARLLAQPVHERIGGAPLLDAASPRGPPLQA